MKGLHCMLLQRYYFINSFPKNVTGFSIGMSCSRANVLATPVTDF